MKKLRIPVLFCLLATGFVSFFLADAPTTRANTGAAVVQPTPPPKGGSRSGGSGGDSATGNSNSNSRTNSANDNR